MSFLKSSYRYKGLPIYKYVMTKRQAQARCALTYIINICTYFDTQ